MAKKSKNGSVQRLDTKYFSTAIQELNSAIDMFESALGNIKRQTSTLQANWDGSGAGKFDKAYNRLKKEFDDQSENLTAIRDDLQTILETYQNWDNEMKNNIAGNTMDE